MVSHTVVVVVVDVRLLGLSLSQAPKRHASITSVEESVQKYDTVSDRVAEVQHCEKVTEARTENRKNQSVAQPMQ